MYGKRSLALIVVVITAICFAGSCAAIPVSETPAASGTPTAGSQPPAASAETDLESVDYSSASSWLSLPDNPDKPVDVVFLLPTAWHKQDPNEPNICTIDNETLLAGAQTAYKNGGSAFETVGNIYAPYYRQADATVALALPVDEFDALIGGVPTHDVFDALDYYFKNYNNGRPFILAGHSQGSCILLNVLSDYMKQHPDYYSRMIACYAIGWSVTKDYLDENPHLQFADGPDDIGVIISYNTEAPEIGGPSPVVREGAIAINPITWVRTDASASAAQNLGSMVDGVRTPDYADATVDTDRGVVICSSVDPNLYHKEGSPFPLGVFHGQDYPFYYFDIRANAELRVNAYLSSLEEQRAA